MKPVLILGAGINGAALARELVLNDVPVCLVDIRDIASGTTAYSSRLIHGGLRYLEYADFSLVAESLGERTRLLELAPQFVRPLELFIPVESRLTGLVGAAAKFFGIPGKFLRRPTTRGLFVVHIGLWFYDWLARSSKLPRHRLHRVGDDGVPTIDPESFRWACSYFDAQIPFVERFVVAMLTDARELAARREVPFDVYTYHSADLKGGLATIASVSRPDETVRELEPAAVVNATGVWLDSTLKQLNVESKRLIGGTKGSHLFTPNQALRESLGGKGIYAEATDGRPIFLLPFGEGTLIGTTDLPYEQPPEDAVADADEIDYLLESTQRILPHVSLGPGDVELHYSGVRPLPHQSADTPGAITRRHQVIEHEDTRTPFFSIVGGKLTTCRSLAEETTETILDKLGMVVKATSQTRVVPGGGEYPDGEQELKRRLTQISQQTLFSKEQVREVWDLCGSRTEALLSELDRGETNQDPAENVDGSSLPLAFVRQIIRDEWATRLEDLVERRLMLLYKRVTHRGLSQLAQLLVEEGRLAAEQVDEEIASCKERLRSHFGKNTD